MKNLCLFLLLLFAARLPAQLPKILIQDGVFRDETGDCFTPFGYNYLGDPALLEDDWMTSEGWNRHRENFREMRGYQANTVRIHLQYNRFMTDAQTPDQAAFNRLAELVQMAEEEQLYLLITGLSAYRATDQPAWYNNLDETGRWATQALFWHKVAETVGSSGAVFGYDLMNEPVVNDTTTWLPGAPFGGYQFVQNLTRTPNGRSFDQIVHQWSAQMVQAIREKDAVTPITTGFIACGPVRLLSAELDFISTHTYPSPNTDPPGFCSMRLDDLLHLVDINQDVKPFVISEIAMLASFAETDSFMRLACPQVNGWINHYHGKRLEEYSDTNWVEILQRYNLNWFKAQYTQSHQCQTACGGDVACLPAAEPDPDLVFSISADGQWMDQSGYQHQITNYNVGGGTGSGNQVNGALNFIPIFNAALQLEHTERLQFRHDQSFTILMMVHPRTWMYGPLLIADDKDQSDGDAPAARDVVRLEVNDTGLFDGQAPNDGVFYFTFTYGHDNSTFLTPLERLESACFTSDEWYAVAAVYDHGKDSSYLYVNGHLQDQIAHQIAAPWHCNGQSILIGRNDIFQPVLPVYYNGKIEFVKLFNRALAPQELAPCASAPNNVVCTEAVSTVDPGSRSTFSMQPNPARTATTLTWGQNIEPISISMIDVAGRVLHHWETGLNQPYQLPLHTLPAGIYSIRIADRHGKVWVEKLVVGEF